MECDEKRVCELAGALAYGCMEASLYMDSTCPMQGTRCPFDGGCRNITREDWLDWVRGTDAVGTVGR